MGIEFEGESGVTDLPEVMNYSAGIYDDTVGFDPTWAFIDAEVAELGLTQTISAGNCGVVEPTYSCTTPHRVSTPGNAFNTITVGGLDDSADIEDSSTWVPWQHTSPGPTYDGRKKPDLIAQVGGNGSTPSASNDTDYVSSGYGTSFAAPNAAAGALLLASTGVYAPTAQKAILINSATPIQDQEYWSPRSGWGALNLDGAYHQRGYYANSAITPSSNNGARFFELTGVSVDDRSTLVWNRRTAGEIIDPEIVYSALTDLDLTQIDPTTGDPTSTGGSDANDTVDTHQIVTADNPLPGGGTDGGDNVEQVRSTATGTQLLKVKSMSNIDGASNELFSVASSRPVAALETPIPEVATSTNVDASAPGSAVTVTATVTNPSDDLALASAQATLNLPAGVDLVSGSASQSLGTLGTNGNAVATWGVEGTTEGLKSLTVAASGTTYSEQFEGSDSATLTVDGSAPVLAVTGPGAYADTASPQFHWSADDASPIDHYDVTVATNNGPFLPLIEDTISTSAVASGSEGETVTLRVVAVDVVGNESNPVDATTVIDSVPPSIAVGAAETSFGRVSVPVAASNAGSPITTSVAFSINPNAPLAVLIGNSASFTNTASTAVTATLRVAATDGLGRTTTHIQKFRVPSRLKAADLRLAKPQSRNGQIVLRGSIARGSTGKVHFAVRRIGKQGTRRLTKASRIRGGRFAARLRLASGRYVVRATFSGSRTVAKATASRRITVR